MKKPKRKNIFDGPGKRQHMTPAEGLIVLTIVVVLGGIALPNIREIQMSGCVCSNVSQIALLMTAVETYHIDCFTFPLETRSSRFIYDVSNGTVSDGGIWMTALTFSEEPGTTETIPPAR